MRKVFRLAIVALVVAGLIVLIPTIFNGEFASIILLPGDIINVFWEQLLFEITKDQYFTLGNPVKLFCFIFYFFIVFVIAGSVQILSQGSKKSEVTETK